MENRKIKGRASKDLVMKNRIMVSRQTSGGNELFLACPAWPSGLGEVGCLASLQIKSGTEKDGIG